MKKLSILTFIAAFVSIGTISTTPAKATHLTKVEYDGKFDVQIRFPMPINLQENVDASYTVDNFSGRLSDAGDAELTINNPFSSLSSGLSNLLNGKNIKIDFWSGTGAIYKEQNLLSQFNFNYNKFTDILTIKDYNFDNIKECVTSTCKLDGKGEFKGFINDFSMLPVLGNLNFNIDQTATPILHSQPIPDVQPVVQPLPATSKSVPEPSFLLGLIGLGGIFAAKRKQQKAI